jgi:hypothetical protein
MFTRDAKLRLNALHVLSNLSTSPDRSVVLALVHHGIISVSLSFFDEFPYNVDLRRDMLEMLANIIITPKIPVGLLLPDLLIPCVMKRLAPGYAPPLSTEELYSLLRLVVGALRAGRTHAVHERWILRRRERAAIAAPVYAAARMLFDTALGDSAEEDDADPTGEVEPFDTDTPESALDPGVCPFCDGTNPDDSSSSDSDPSAFSLTLPDLPKAQFLLQRNIVLRELINENRFLCFDILASHQDSRIQGVLRILRTEFLDPALNPVGPTDGSSHPPFAVPSSVFQMPPP